jgi:hypothetical protein
VVITEDTLPARLTNIEKPLADTLLKDSTNVDVKTYTIADDDLDDVVSYYAVDSIVYDIPGKAVLLYGNARIKYKEMDMAAGFIRYDMDSSEVYAKAMPDSSGALRRVEFKDESGEYISLEAKYNFKTKKGKSVGLITRELEGYLHGDQVKAINDSTLYIRNARYTTCDLDDPHFYIELGKAKVIKDHIMVGKPANLVIEGVRTPLFLPFAMLPSLKSKGTGLLMPEYGETAEQGFYLRGLGYYWHINDKMDLTTTADIYTLGSFGFHINYAYRVNYKLAGNLSIEFTRSKTGVEEERFNPHRQKPPFDFGIRWQTNIDPKRLFNSSFNININIISNKRFQNLAYNDPQSVLATTFTSNVSFSKYWPNKPYRIALNASVNQNTQTKRTTIGFPQFSFNVTRINPFQRKVNVTTRKWYENIGFAYDMFASNQLDAPDSTLFSKKTLKDMRNSITHSLPISGNFTLFKFLNFNVGFNYRENWYFSYINKTYYDTFVRIDEFTGRVDTLLHQAVAETKYGFKSYRDFNLNMSLNTNLYGLFQFKKGKLKAIRHTFRPSLNFNFSPDFTKSFWKYNRTVQSDSLGNRETYSIFQNNGITPPGKQGSIGLSFGNTLEIKVYSKKDSVNHSKKITLLDNLSVSMNYNIPTKRLSPLTINASTHLTDKLNLSMNVNMDPYSVDSLGRQTNSFYWREKHRFFRLTNMNVSLSGSVRSKKGMQETSEFNNALLQRQGVNNQFFQNNVYERDVYNFDIPWSVNYQYSLNLTRFKFNKRDTTAITQTIAMGLDVNITKKWKVNISSGFDLTNKSVTRTDISVVRDLHCWQMEFKWTPLGFQQGFYISIYVTSQQFSWLKLQKQKAFFDSGIFGSTQGFSQFGPQ